MVQELQKKNVLLMILLTIITCGIYGPIWFVSQKDALNSLKSKEKISNAPLVFVLVIFIIFVILLINFATIRIPIIEAIPGFGFLFLLVFILVAVGNVIILMTSFKVRRILNTHFSTKLSGVATYLFTFFYLQHKINCLLEAKFH